jgi:hypothetical protein
VRVGRAPPVLRRANKSGRGGGPWKDEDYDVFDGDRRVGRIFQIDAYPGSEAWFWGLIISVEAQLGGKKRYGREPTRGPRLAIFACMLWRTGRPPKRLGIIVPCIPTRASKPPVGPRGIHEIKHDGYRLIARKRDGRVRLFTRRGYDWTQRYPRIAAAVGRYGRLRR